MIRIFKIILERRPSGYTLQEDVLFFSDATPHEQCDEHGNIVSDPLFSIDYGNRIITEVINPETLGLAEHARHPIINSAAELKLLWQQAAEHPQTIFTTIPVPVFPDLFHLELTI